MTTQRNDTTPAPSPAAEGLQGDPAQHEDTDDWFGAAAEPLERLANAVLEYVEWDEGDGCRYCTEIPHADDCVTRTAAAYASQTSEGTE